MSKNRSELKLWYRKPANEWIQGLPVGNGRVGGMVYGGPSEEIIALNDDTLWSGQPKQAFRSEAAHYVGPVRELLFHGEMKQAQKLVEQHMLGAWQQSYMPLAFLKATVITEGPVSDYRRELDLRKACAASEFQMSDRTTIVRQCFVSAPDNLLVYRLSASKSKRLNVELEWSSLLKHTVLVEGAMLYLIGECPSHVEPHYVPSNDPILYGEDEATKGMAFGAALKVISSNGVVEADNGKLRITGADAVTLLISTATGYKGYDKTPSRDGDACIAECLRMIGQVSAKPFEWMLRHHISAFSELFSRVELQLGVESQSHMPTNERLASIREGCSDPSLVALLYQFGRYLLISSSRPGTQPANLQGIWNDCLRPYWSSNWTANINVQMNYWLAEGANLAECHQPLLQLIEDLGETGKKTARSLYDCDGWTVHHNIDLWRTTTPAAGLGEHFACCSFWPLGGAWLSQHLWEHFAFNRNIGYLKERAYPTMREAAQFCLDWLTEDKQGYQVTAPSTSPENSYLNNAGERTTVSIASTSDMSMIWELFSNCIEASRILEREEPFRNLLIATRERLFPLRIGRYGQLQEWFDDPEDYEIHHRHISHLFGLHPGTRIRPKDRPDLVNAVRTSLQRRASGENEPIGWSLAWMVNQYARLGLANEAIRSVYRFMSNSLYDSMLGYHAPLSASEEAVFQIDGNFGIAAGVNEMLVQSHLEEIVLLPALPDEWQDGSVSGLRARGGIELAVTWHEGKLREATIRSDVDHTVRLRYGISVIELHVVRNGTYQLTNSDFGD